MKLGPDPLIGWSEPPHPPSPPNLPIGKQPSCHNCHVTNMRLILLVFISLLRNNGCSVKILWFYWVHSFPFVCLFLQNEPSLTRYSTVVESLRSMWPFLGWETSRISSSIVEILRGLPTGRPSDPLSRTHSVQDLLLLVFIVHLFLLPAQERKLDVRAFFAGQLPHQVCLPLKIYKWTYIFLRTWKSATFSQTNFHK